MAAHHPLRFPLIDPKEHFRREVGPIEHLEQPRRVQLIESIRTDKQPGGADLFVTAMQPFGRLGQFVTSGKQPASRE